ncbi:hypothetical protein AKJ16_DCAP08236, partial [Drosera capensis]
MKLGQDGKQLEPAAKTLINEFYPIISVDFCLLDSVFFFPGLCFLEPVVVVERSRPELAASVLEVEVAEKSGPEEVEMSRPEEVATAPEVAESSGFVVVEGTGLQLVGVESRR